MTARTSVVLILLAALIGFALGWWPGYQKTRTMAEESAAMKQQLSDTEARASAAETKLRQAGLLGQALALGDALARNDFSRAETMSTTLFDGVRSEVMAASADKAAFEQVLAMRDPVTAAIARRDPAAAGIVRRGQEMLRKVLGYPVEPMEIQVPAGPAPAAPAGAAPAPPEAAKGPVGD